jgi:hypothetical protein
MSCHNPFLDWIHLLLYISGCTPYLAAIHLWPQSISGRNPSLAAIHLLAIHLASAIHFHQVRYCACMGRIL